MTNRADILEALAERVEKASALDRELDRAVWLQLCGPADRQAYEEGLAISKEEAEFRADYMMDGCSYTASLDAAMTLAPEGAGLKLDRYWLREGEAWSAGIHTGGIPTDPARAFVSEDAHSAALALTSACLRAHASIERSKNNG